MGISEGLPEGAEVDCSAGTIVWVRRRNGSWWPGRILGMEELSASHLMSPRSGTPVKLLGREDASVDWYNLEKSKRVKAFRCGDFDDCIERAESSQGMPIKKREKYARREDAILHALELEKQQLEKKQQNFTISSVQMTERLGSPENLLDNNGASDPRKFALLQSQPYSKMSDSSLKEESLGNSVHAHKGKHLRQPSWEDDNSETVPRMRGLQDFGLRIAPSKRKISTPASFNDYEDHSPNHVSNNKSSPTVRRKRSQGGPTEELFFKRRDRRRPLVQVLQSSAKLTSCHLPSNGIALSVSAQGDKEQVGVVFRAKRSKCIYLPSESDDCTNLLERDSHLKQLSDQLEDGNACSGSSSEDKSISERGYPAPDMEEETSLLSDHPAMRTAEAPSNSAKSIEKKPSDEVEALDESAFPDDASQLHLHEQSAGISADMGGSKWQLKGKRNIRNLSKKPVEVIDSAHHVITADKLNGSAHGILWESKGKPLMAPRTGQRRPGGGVYRRGDGLSYIYDDADMIENDLVQAPVVEYADGRYPFMFKTSVGDRGRRNLDITDSDEDCQAGLRGYWESDEGFNPVYVGHLGNGMDSMLVDVDLKVQASYQGEHVPLVSLMSRLNGKAIIGHPVQIETLEDGSSEFLLPAADFFEESLPDNDGNANLPPVWRTARRTVMHRIPRPPPSAMDGQETDHLQYSDFEAKPGPYTGALNNKTWYLKNKYSHGGRTLTDRKYKKQLKKANLSSQKTRTLSSIATEQRFHDPNPVNNNSVLIKPESSAPSIPCVPVKLVFTRILESVRPAYRSERNPSYD